MDTLQSLKRKCLMRTARNLIVLFCGVLLLLSCAGSKYVVEKNPNRHNPVDEIAWLKERKKALSQAECRITLYEKEGALYYVIYMPTPGAFDKNTTTVYDSEGKMCLKYGGLMPPARREAVRQFFEGAIDKGVIWECKLRETDAPETRP